MTLRSLTSRIQRLDHHLLLVSIGNNQGSCLEHHPHGVDYPMKAASSPALLGKSNNAEWLLLAVLDNRDDLGCKGHFFEVQN